MNSTHVASTMHPATTAHTRPRRVSSGLAVLSTSSIGSSSSSSSSVSLRRSSSSSPAPPSRGSYAPSPPPTPPLIRVRCLSSLNNAAAPRSCSRLSTRKALRTFWIWPTLVLVGALVALVVMGSGSGSGSGGGGEVEGDAGDHLHDGAATRLNLEDTRLVLALRMREDEGRGGRREKRTDLCAPSAVETYLRGTIRGKMSTSSTVQCLHHAKAQRRRTGRELTLAEPMPHVDAH